MIVKWCMCWYFLIHFCVNAAALLRVSKNSSHWSASAAPSKLCWIWFFGFCFSSHFNELQVRPWWCDYEKDLGIILRAWAEPTASLWTHGEINNSSEECLRATFIALFPGVIQSKVLTSRLCKYALTYTFYHSILSEIPLISCFSFYIFYYQLVWTFSFLFYFSPIFN